MTQEELRALSIEELESLNTDLDQKIQALRGNKKLVTYVIDEKVAHEERVRMLDTMSDRQKAALVQAIEAEGIPSEEQVNG